MRRSLFLIALLLLIITACAPQAAATEEQSVIIKRPTATPTRVRPEPTATLAATPTRIPASITPVQPTAAIEQEVIEQLAANLGLQESDVSVVSSEAVEFRDGCLDVAMPDVMCTQVITPGRILILEANGVQYEYHTSEDGSRVQPATLALVWKRSGGVAGFCDTLTVFLSGEVYATRCKPQADGRMGTLANLLSAEELSKFADGMTTFAVAELDASDPRGVADRMEVTLDLFGNGTQPPTKADQQALFEFSQDLYKELSQ